MGELRVVLLGVIGSGKTSLFNHLTFNKQPVRAGGDSVTKSIVVGVSHLAQHLEVIDTPGFEVEEDKILHAAGVIAALTMGQINRILIISKFERDSRMMTALQQILNPISRYRDCITIIISHWDLSEDKQGDEKNIKKKLLERFNIKSVLFYSKYDNPKFITLSILNIIGLQNKTSIKLTDTETYYQFDLMELDGEIKTKLEENKQKLLIEFRKITNIFKNYIKNNIRLDKPDAIDLLHSIQLYIKNVGNKQIEKFERQHGDEMNKFYETNQTNIKYLHHIYLKKEIVKDIESVIKLAQEKMRETKNCFYQNLKKCPNCGLVWLKVVGCDKETTCGNRVNSKKDKIQNISSYQNRYEFSIMNGSLHVDKLQIQENQQEQSFDDWLYRIARVDKNFIQILGNNFTKEQFINIFKVQIGNQYTLLRMKYFLNIIGDDDYLMIQQLYKSFNIQQHNNNSNRVFGCGYKFVWSELPILHGVELQELLSSEMLDFFSDQEQLQNDESKFLEQYFRDQVKQAIQEQIDKSTRLQRVEIN